MQSHGVWVSVLARSHSYLSTLRLPCPTCELKEKAQSCEFCNTEVYCILFWPIFLPLQVAPGFACSVASLNQSPGHQLPGCHSLRCGTLADYLLG